MQGWFYDVERNENKADEKQTLWIQPHEKHLGVKEAFSLDGHEQVRLRDTVTGDIRCARGPQLIFPGSTEEAIGGKVESAIHLSPWVKFISLLLTIYLVFLRYL